MSTLKFAVFSAALLAVVSAPTLAHETGDIIVRAGAAGVFPNDDSDSLNAIPGANVTVEDTWSLGLTGTYMVTNQLGIGLLGAWPFKHDIEGDGTISNLDKVAEVKHLPPTLTLQYHFATRSNLHPYIGAGLNYTYFFDEETSGTLDGTKIDLESSFGFALEAGVDFEFNDGWLISGQVWYANIETEANISGGGLGLNENIDVEIDPVIFMVGIGKKF